MDGSHPAGKALPGAEGVRYNPVARTVVRTVPVDDVVGPEAGPLAKDD